MERLYTVDDSSRESRNDGVSSRKASVFGGLVLGRDRRFCGPVLTVKLGAGETHGGTVNEISLRCALLYIRTTVHTRGRGCHCDERTE